MTGITTGSGTTSYLYDYTGARVQKSSATSVTTYISRLYDVTDGTVTKHIFAGGRRIASNVGGNIYYYHPDHLGSLNIATDTSGNQAQAVSYYPFGAVLTNSGTVDLPYKFTGKQLDLETGFYYFGARYYDPAQGRFITPDTIVQSPGDPQSLNRYAYARNNPLAFVDPTGHGFFSELFGFIADIFEALFAAFVGAVVTVFTGNPVLGGMAAGAIMGAYSGNLTNVVMGAITGGILGALPSPFNVFAQAGLFGYAVARNGPNALLGFAAGFIGGMAGWGAGTAFADSLNPTINQGFDTTAGYNTNMRIMVLGQSVDIVVPVGGAIESGVVYDSNGFIVDEIGLQPSIPTPDVATGFDSPVGGVNTTLSLDDSMMQTEYAGSSYNYSPGSGVNYHRPCRWPRLWLFYCIKNC